MKKTVRQKKASPINHTNTAEMSSKKSGVAQGYGILPPTVGAIANSPMVTQQQKKLDTMFGTAQREKKPEEDEKLMQPKWVAIQREIDNDATAKESDNKSITGSFQAKISGTDAKELTQQKAIQRKKGEDDEEKLPGQAKAITQRVENKTGMPDNLKVGMEQLSGLDMSDVHVHYNSAKPASVQAHAYTQGTDIHVAPGQEKHVGHEAWHVAQQKQGRVQPTTTVAGIPVNDNPGLEHEADVMGAKASRL
ncbi:MAG: DUF4157 domain-containing protein [Paludibacteraceae bacterium]|nr:DUF4157 domain-containing protein [Paludibacteraceae bacterium]